MTLTPNWCTPRFFGCVYDEYVVRFLSLKNSKKINPELNWQPLERLSNGLFTFQSSGLLRQIKKRFQPNKDNPKIAIKHHGNNDCDAHALLAIPILGIKITLMKSVIDAVSLCLNSFSTTKLLFSIFVKPFTFTAYHSALPGHLNYAIAGNVYFGKGQYVYFTIQKGPILQRQMDRGR